MIRPSQNNTPFSRTNSEGELIPGRSWDGLELPAVGREAWCTLDKPPFTDIIIPIIYLMKMNGLIFECVYLFNDIISFSPPPGFIPSSQKDEKHVEEIETLQNKGMQVLLLRPLMLAVVCGSGLLSGFDYDMCASEAVPDVPCHPDEDKHCRYKWQEVGVIC